ncbi:hypothetical protein L1285_03445 [Pseudoalteromonas sp. DL2-H2.2]|uniref:hypothetical protein n=1 Tax=Pseudoalteromonas sp. DL2-H2.2 TaxID=2908889 RepID=UPI001F489B10|nr:hypothetical protein [Pseudoalteromonas sp. DL2-H2.2]MCF2907369.1 hypothetical protein [Pseudoalteromonas sp. DL2-H2.2]
MTNIDINSDSLKPLLGAIFDSQMMLVSLSVILFCFLKDRLALRYSLLCFAFFVNGYLTHDLILELDTHMVFRYIYWAAADILFIAIVAYWALKDKMYMWQSIICQLVVIPAPLLQLFRLVDRHLMELSYSGYFYKTILPLVNYATVFLCFAPLIYLLGRKRVSSQPPQDVS